MPPKGVQAAMPKISPGVAKMIEAFNEFGPGVPATDKVCKELLKVLEVQWQQTHDNGVETPWLHNEEAKDDYALVFHINEDYCVEIGKREEENGALSVNAVFRHRRTLALVPPLIQGTFAPDGLREALTRTRRYADDLRARGPCPKCPDDAKNLRSPSADFCEICCFKVALGV